MSGHWWKSFVPLFYPLLVEVAEGAVGEGLVEPVVCLFGQLAPLGQHVGFVVDREWLFWVHGAQLGTLFFLVDGFDSVGDHDVGLACDELIEHARVVLPNGESGLREIRSSKLLIGAPGVLDHPHAVSIDLIDRYEAARVGHGG